MQYSQLFPTNANAPYTILDLSSMTSTPLRFTSSTPVHGLTLDTIYTNYNNDAFFLLKNDDTQEVYQFLFPKRSNPRSDYAHSITIEMATYYSDTQWSYSLTNQPSDGYVSALSSKVNLDNDGYTNYSLNQWWTWVQEGQAGSSISQATFGALNAEVNLYSATTLPLDQGAWPAGRYSFWAYDFTTPDITTVGNVWLMVEKQQAASTVNGGVIAGLVIIIVALLFGILWR